MKRGQGIWKRMVAIMLAIVLVVTMMPMAGMEAQAARKKKVALSKKSVSVQVGKKVKVTLKNVNKKVTWKVISGKKIVSITKKSGRYKNTITMKGKKAGAARIQATYKKKKYVVKVKVKKKKATTQAKNTTENKTEKTTAETDNSDNKQETTTQVSDDTDNKKPEDATGDNGQNSGDNTGGSTDEGNVEDEQNPGDNTGGGNGSGVDNEEMSSEEETPGQDEGVGSEEGTEEELKPGEEETPGQDEETDTEESTEELPQNVELDSYLDKVDVASSSSAGEGNETIDKLFDGDVNTKFFTGDACPIRIAWQVQRPVIVERYTLTTANDSATYSYRNPLAWHLYGSNDGTSWTQIDKVDASGIGAVNFTAYSYETDVQEAFQYYLLQIESNGGYYGLQLSEISIFGDVAEVTEDLGVDLNEHVNSIDSNSTTVNGYNDNEVVANLFDGDLKTKLFSVSPVPGSIGWKMDKTTTLYSYTLTTANDSATYTGRNPKSWILYGSTDGNTWDVIDTVKNSGMKDVNTTPYTYIVDKVSAYQYYKLEITALDGNSFQLSEITLKGAAASSSEYDILFTGDWDLITSDTYVEELVKLFYNSYPRLYARWGTGTEPKIITFKADSTYDGVAYCQGTTVCVSTTYANANPNDIGFFSHEITHSVQQYSGKLNYGDDVAWWTENMANYGGFRYFHWSNPKYVQIYEASDTSLQDWGYEQYGNNKWFFAYMDAKYPTRKDANGNKVYGLIDRINLLIKNNTGNTYTDDPYLVGSPFNNVVKEITGYDCIESLRLKYVEDLKSGAWTFEGFADYEDNWMTEDIPGIPNPEYPMLGEKEHGNKTATQLDAAITTGTNLCNGATVMDCSGYVNAEEAPSMLIDGNLSTKWCATSSNVTNPEYKLNGVAHWIKIDLGEQKTFDTYTIYNTQSKEGYGNATEWEVLVSNDGENWVSVDYQELNNNAIASFDIGEQTARYVFIKIFTPDDRNGTLRWYDFQLYNR